MLYQYVKYSIPVFIFLCLFPVLLISQELKSNGKICNSGKIIIKGNASFTQDSINGTIEFTQNQLGFNQYIPQIKYERLRLKGMTPKILSDSTKNLIVSEEFASDNNVVLKFHQNTELFSQGTTIHQGIINPAFLYGNVVMNGNKLQEIYGKGLFRNLIIDNKNNVIITNSGGFHISNYLVLKNGILINDPNNNLIMDDNSVIARYSEGKLNSHPIIDGRISIEYLGDGLIETGKEIPINDTCKAIYVLNSEGIELTNNINVSDSIVLLSNIYTSSLNKEYSLNFYGNGNPDFLDENAEIIGSFRRFNLNNNRRIFFNNAFTFIDFDGKQIENISNISLKVKPSTSPIHTAPNQVNRLIIVEAVDTSGKKIDEIPEFTFGYGWRHPTETMGVKLSDLILQRYTGDFWRNLISSEKPQQNDNKEWAFSKAYRIKNTGEFTISLPSPQSSNIFAKVFLEGAFMSKDMLGSEIIPYNEISSHYPYYLFDKEVDINTKLDSITDYILFEFKDANTNQMPLYQIAFIKSDGKIIDTQGNYPISIPFDSIKPGEYYLSILHHNHLDIITEEVISISQNSSNLNLDFTKPDLLLGRANSLKLISIDGTTISWAMIAGDIDNNNIIDEVDLGLIYDNLGNNNWFYDINYLGSINTNDYNFVWNNLGRVSAIIK